MNPLSLPVRPRARYLLRSAALLLATALLLTLAPAPARAAPMPADHRWLDIVNAYRATAGVPAVTASSALTSAAAKHSAYMATNTEVTHFEDPSKPGYTLAGDVSGRNSNVAGTYRGSVATPRWFVDAWMKGPFHALGVLDPRLRATGFGQDHATTSRWVFTAGTLDVLSNRAAGVPTAFTWPGNGATVPLGSYDGGEQPDPLAPCAGYSAPTGLPLIAAFGTSVRLSSASVTVLSGTASGTRLPVCAYDESGHPSSIASDALHDRGAVIVVPRAPLSVCTNYRLDVRTTDGRRQVSTFHVAAGTFAPAGAGVPANPSCTPAPGSTDDTGSGDDTGSSEPAPSFSDVPRSNIFSDDIGQLAAAGITRGCNPPTNTRFCPSGHVTRGQMAAFLVRALDLPAGPGSFADTRGHTFERDIAALAAAGITRGCGPTRFCPDEPVTRGQMAAFLDRALGLPSGTATFADARGHTFQHSIAALAAAGITKGCNPPANTRFCPDAPVTRGQMAAFLVRAGLS